MLSRISSFWPFATFLLIFFVEDGIKWKSYVVDVVYKITLTEQASEPSGGNAQGGNRAEGESIALA